MSIAMSQRSLGGTAANFKVGEIGYGLMGRVLLDYKTDSFRIHYSRTSDS